MAKAVKEDRSSIDGIETESADPDFSSMTGSDKAAVLMLLLGEEQAANIIPFLNPKEVNSLGASMVSVANLSQDTVNQVLDDFILTVKTQTNLGLGSSDYVINVLNKALGEDKAATVLGKIMPPSSNEGLDILQWMDPRAIAEIIVEEPPQVAAIVLSVLESPAAAEVLGYLPADRHVHILQRIAMLDSVQPSAMKALESVVSEQFSNSSAKSSTIGGIEAAAGIMNFSKSDLSSQVMKALSIDNNDLANQIQEKMVTFDNFVDMDDRSVQTLLRSIEQEDLMVALRGADQTIKDRFLENMSERARLIFIDDMEAKGPARVSDVENAQQKILRIARKLSDDGEIMMSSGGEDFV
jgi:flagellar motor switch protein FliG